MQQVYFWRSYKSLCSKSRLCDILEICHSFFVCFFFVFKYRFGGKYTRNFDELLLASGVRNRTFWELLNCNVSCWQERSRWMIIAPLAVLDFLSSYAAIDNTACKCISFFFFKWMFHLILVVIILVIVIQVLVLFPDFIFFSSLISWLVARMDSSTWLIGLLKSYLRRIITEDYCWK